LGRPQGHALTVLSPTSKATTLSVRLAFGFLLGRVLGLSHPPTQNQVTPLTKGRMILGIVTFIIFILCFSPQPFVIS